MTEKTEGRGPKPDGSAYAAHLAAINQRNAASKKAGKERREKHELGQIRERRESDRLLDKAIEAKR